MDDFISGVCLLFLGIAFMLIAISMVAWARDVFLQWRSDRHAGRQDKQDLLTQVEDIAERAWQHWPAERQEQ